MDHAPGQTPGQPAPTRSHRSARSRRRIALLAALGLGSLALAGTVVYGQLTGPINGPATALRPATRLGSSGPATPGSTTPGPITPGPIPPGPVNPGATVPVGRCAPQPSACGYPDASNTGVLPGVTLRTVPDQVTSGPGWQWNPTGGFVAVTGNGALLDGLLVNAPIDVTGSNVTIRNSRIIVTGEVWGIALRHSTNVTIENVEIYSPFASGSSRLMVGIKDINSDSTGLSILRSEIYHTATGIQIDAGLIQDNYIHDLGYVSPDHVNGTTSNGGTTQLTIRHNTIFNPHDQTDAISLFQDFGGQGNRTIEDNLLAGGGYSFYGGEGPTSSFNIHVINNRFARLFYPNGGFCGPVTTFQTGGVGNVWSGNVWDDTGSPSVGLTVPATAPRDIRSGPAPIPASSMPASTAACGPTVVRRERTTFGTSAPVRGDDVTVRPRPRTPSACPRG